MNPPLTRRDFLKAAGAAGAAGALGLTGCGLPDYRYDDRGLTAAAAILRAGYDANLLAVIEAGLELVPPPDVRGKRVLLKPNLVDLPRDNKPVTTHPSVIVAAAEAFRRRGAAEIIVGDGPALQRDAWQIADAIGLTPLLDEHSLPFFDLNLGELAAVANGGTYLGMPTLYYSRRVMEADVLVSIPKMKVHHWAGVSLAMKNLYGTLSSVAYGWPRNAFHLRGLHNGVLDFNLTRPADYAIIDGIVGLEGDGPVRGTPIDVGVIVMGSNCTAVDATATRIMGFAPERIEYLRRSAGLLGPIGEESIEQRGESIAAVRTPFRTIESGANLVI